MTLKRLLELYGAGEVKRLHTVPTHRTQSIAEHVYGSMLVAMELCTQNNVPCGNVLVTLLYHDAPEIDTGDIPAPVKRASRPIRGAIEDMELMFYDRLDIRLPTLTELEARIVHAADCFDLAFTCYRERVLGNRAARVELVFSNCMNYLLEHDNAPILNLRKELKEIFYAI